MLFRSAPSEKFDDIKKHWTKDSIDYVVGRGLFTGSTKNTFSPNEKMTRGMLVTVLGRLAGVNVKNYEKNSFSDVKKDSFYHPYIEWAYSKGVIYGIRDGKFSPDRNITREEITVKGLQELHRPRRLHQQGDDLLDLVGPRSGGEGGPKGSADGIRLDQQNLRFARGLHASKIGRASCRERV